MEILPFVKLRMWEIVVVKEVTAWRNDMVFENQNDMIWIDICIQNRIHNR